MSNNAMVNTFLILDEQENNAASNVQNGEAQTPDVVPRQIGKDLVKNPSLKFRLSTPFITLLISKEAPSNRA